MVPLGLLSARPMAQALRLPFEYYIYIIILFVMLYQCTNVCVTEFEKRTLMLVKMKTEVLTPCSSAKLLE